MALFQGWIRVSLTREGIQYRGGNITEVGVINFDDSPYVKIDVHHTERLRWLDDSKTV